MDDNNYHVAFELILAAGDSKSQSLSAIEYAREFKFEEAENCLREAKKEMGKSHRMQMEMIQQEAKGNPVDVNIILVHAQDHLTMAIMAKDFSEEFVNIYKIIAELKNNK